MITTCSIKPMPIHITDEHTITLDHVLRNSQVETDGSVVKM